MKTKNSIVATLALSLALGFSGPLAALAATSPSIGAESPYGIVSSTFTNANTAPQTIINGDVCDTTPPTTQPTTTNGVTTTGGCDPATGTAQNTALNNVTDGLNTQSCVSLGTNVVLSGTYTPGCYSSSGSMDVVLSTSVTLSGAGTYIFRAGGALTTGANANIVLTNGANASNVFWAPVGATTLGANTAFVGNILDAAGISLGHFATLLGRALAFGGTVTTDANTITVPTTLSIIKLVVNTSGGTAVASDFMLHVKNGGVDIAGSPAVGTSTPGTFYVLSAGTYAVSENTNSLYTQIFSGDCDSSGNVTLTLGSEKICTIVNTDILALVAPSAQSGNGAGNYFAPLPLINITKVPSPLALPSGSGLVTYTYTVTNVGPIAMIGVWVKDDKCSAVNFISGDTNNDSSLDLNETWTYRCTTTVSKTTTNVATAHGQAGGWDTYDIADATVVVGAPVVPPLIHVVKKPNVFLLPAGGGIVTYFYWVTNPGTAPLSNVSITDDKCTGLPGRVVGHPGDLNKNNLLESNETWQFTCQTRLTQTTTNLGTATGQAHGLTAVDLSPATVVVTAPGLPNTGISPESNPWGAIIPLGILVTLSALYLGRKKSAQ